MVSENKFYQKWWFWVVIGVVILGILGALLPSDSSSSSDNSLPTGSSDSDSSGSGTVTTPTVEEEIDTATIGEKNALSGALSYLRSSAFSYSGLIEQLEYEGYTYEEAKYGVDNSGADWNEQAALQAQSYLDSLAFSREGLIEQLEYEGFTKEQAEYGVQAVGY